MLLCLCLSINKIIIVRLVAHSHGRRASTEEKVKERSMGAVTRKIAEADTLLAEEEPDLARLTQVKVTLEEKRDILRVLDEAIGRSPDLSEAELVEEYMKLTR